MADGKRIKAVIADDEKIIIELIKRLGNWEELGIDIVATAADGLSAYQLIEENQPDIVIVDIRMPEIDGIELIKRCKAQNISAHFLIISGYQEFDYAKQAITFNVAEYLVKPIDQNELNTALKKIKDKILSAEIYTQQISDMKNKIIQQNMALWDQLFMDLGAERPMPRDIDVLNQRYGLAMREGYFNILAVKLDIERDVAILYYNMLKEFLENEMREKTSGLIFNLAYSSCDMQMYYLFNYNKKSTADLLTAFKLIAEKAQNYMSRYEHCAVTFGISNAGSDVSRLGELYTQVQSCLEYRRSDNNTGKTYVYDETIEAFLEKQKKVTLRNETRETLYDLFQIHDPGRFEKLVKELTKQSATDISKLYKNYRLLQEFSELFLKISENYDFCNEIVKEYREQIYYLFRHAPNLSYVFDAAERLLIGTYLNIIEGKTFWNDRHIRAIKHYIENNYQSQIRLEDVARAVNLNANYLSVVFKKRAGMNYNDYIKQVRMEAAKELFSNSYYTVKQVCERVGYQDVKYFTKLFKSYVGVKPTVYQKMHSNV